MDFDRWYRRTKKKADSLVAQGIVVMIAALMLVNVLGDTGDGAGNLRRVFEVLAWGPLVVFLVGTAVVGCGLRMHWRLHDDPVALYQEG